YLDLTFFNQPWMGSTYKEGYEVAVSGIAQLYRGRLQLANQEIELLKGDDQDLVHTGRITPIHRASEGITTRTIRELGWAALGRPGPLSDPMPVARGPAPCGGAAAVRSCDPGHPLPGLATRARRRDRTAEVRRAVRPRAGAGVPKASGGARRDRGAARAGRAAARAPRPNAAVRAHRRAAPGDGADRCGDGAPAPDERPAPRGRRFRQDARRGARGPRRD